MIEKYKTIIQEHMKELFDFEIIKSNKFTILKTKCLKNDNHYMYYNENDGTFTCPICRFSKDLVSLCAEIQDVDEWTIIERIFRHKLKKDIDLLAIDKFETKFNNELLFQINYDAMLFFEKQLEESPEAMKYLKKRNLTEETIKKFRLGYAPHYNKLYKTLKENFRDEDLELAGVVGIDEKTKRPYDVFKDRIIFPIIGVDDNIYGFGGRTIGNSPKKYINTRTTPIFQKSSFLYAYNVIDKSAKIPKLLVSEGYMDVISMHQAGITFAVGNLGTALTPSHYKLMKKVTDMPVILLDGDDAGIQATKKALRNIAKFHTLTLPEELDPDEYILKYGAEKFLEYIENNTCSWEEYWLNDYLEQNQENKSENIFEFFLNNSPKL